MNHQKKMYVSNCNRSRDRGEGVKYPPPLPRPIKVGIEARSVRVKGDNPYNKVKGCLSVCMSVCLFVCTEGSHYNIIFW